MDWTNILIAIIAALGTFAGTAYGIHKANNLTVYRLEQLEKKMDVHNKVQDRVLVMEHTLDRVEAALDKLTERAGVHGEQIDNVYTLAEKNEARITAIEKGIIERG